MAASGGEGPREPVASRRKGLHRHSRRRFLSELWCLRRGWDHARLSRRGRGLGRGRSWRVCRRGRRCLLGGRRGGFSGGFRAARWQRDSQEKGEGKERRPLHPREFREASFPRNRVVSGGKRIDAMAPRRSRRTVFRPIADVALEGEPGNTTISLCPSDVTCRRRRKLSEISMDSRIYGAFARRSARARRLRGGFRSAERRRHRALRRSRPTI